MMQFASRLIVTAVAAAVVSAPALAAELTGAVENGRPVTHLAYATDEQGRPREPQPSAGLLAELRSVRGWS